MNTYKFSTIEMLQIKTSYIFRKITQVRSTDLLEDLLNYYTTIMITTELSSIDFILNWYNLKNL